MSFGGFLESSSGGNMSSGAITQPRLVASTGLTNKSMFTSSGLSLAIQQTNMERNGEISRFGEHIETGFGVRAREDEYESRSGSDNMDGGASGDDQDGDTKPPKKKRYHRHTPQQIQELESLFKECPHPDEKQRLELSRRLNLETRQVKFWFQNRRTQMKTQIERHENSMLRQENDKLRAENLTIRDAMRNPICNNCGGPAMLGDVSLEEQQLRVENARLKDELDRVCALTGKFLGRPMSSLGNGMPSSMTSSGLELAVGLNGYGGLGAVNQNLPMGNEFNGSVSSSLSIPSVMPPHRASVGGVAGFERSIYLELALAAMDELVRMAQTNEPLWLSSGLVGGKEKLNLEEYVRIFPPCIGPKPSGFATEATRQTGIVIINSLALVETLMDSDRWAEMFPSMISKTGTTDVISVGVGGTRNGALQLMQAELQVLSPLVPIREVRFLRFCKQHAEGVWAVVDVSIDTNQGTSNPSTFVNCRRLPSGFVVQDMPNGYSKVTWVEHAEYDEGVIHQLYRPLVNAGMGFGAQRWIANLQRQCECLAVLMSNNPTGDHSGITPSGRRSMLKLAQRMTDNFCAGVCASTVHKWNKLGAGNVDEDVRVMTRKSIDDPGEPPGVVLSAATSVWLPISSQKLFDFVRDERLRSEWDILSNGGPMHEMTHIVKGQDPGNCVSLLRASAMNSNDSSMLILQETCIDASGSLVVYAPVDIPAMHVVMSGGDSAYVALLPSGFAIVPDGSDDAAESGGGGGDDGGATPRTGGGSLLTVAFQILVSSLPTAKLTVESVETVNNLISCTIQKIRAALHCEN